MSFRGKTLRIATRSSALALVQARAVGVAVCEHLGCEVELVERTTRGDQIQDRPLHQVGGKGLFIKEVDAAILDGDADLAVHSMKDLPALLTPGLRFLYTPPRADPTDAWVTLRGEDIDDLESGARVGTTSLRRTCQLKRHRPDLDVRPLRGNVQTRLRRLEEGAFDAIVLATAGIRRLKLDVNFRSIPKGVCLPAAGQGILAVVCKEDREDLVGALQGLADERTWVEAIAERACLEVLEGNCQVPVAAHAEFDGDRGRLTLGAMVGTPDGLQVLHASSDVQTPEATDWRAAARSLGDDVAATLRDQGALDIVREVHATLARQRLTSN